MDRTRLASYAVAAVVVLLSLAASTSDVGDNVVFLLPVAAVPVSIAVATLRRTWSAAVLAIGAFVAATWSPDVPSLWLAMAVLVFGSLAEDRQVRPWMGWAGGLGGASFSIFLYDSGDFAPFLATALGGAAGLLLRSRVRTSELVGEAEELRGQAAWLEQRTSVARELHDVVGHHVTAMVVQAEAGQLGDPKEALRAIGELGRTALAELDSLVVHLRDPGAPLTVSAPPRLLDIDELLAEPLRRAGTAVDVRLGRRAGPGRGRRAHRLPDHAGGADQRRPARRGRPRLGGARPGRRPASGCGSATTAPGRRPSEPEARACSASRSEWRREVAGWRSAGGRAAGPCVDVSLPVGA